MRNHTLVVDINKETCRVLKYKQYDNNLLRIIVEKNDERVSLNGYTGYAFFKLPSGLVIKKDCSVQGSEVTINIDNNVLSESGKIALDLTLSDGNRTFTLFRINLVIEEAINKDDAIIVEAGWDIVSEIAKINKKIDNLDGNGGNNTDLSGYATKDELNNKADKSSIPTKVSQLENDKGYLTEHQDLSHLATKSYVKNEIANAQLGGGDTGVDLSGYATKDELNSKADKTEINSMANLIAMLESQINALRSDVDSLLQNSGGDTEEGSITLSQDTLTFNNIGENMILIANVTGSIKGKDITWQSNNEAVAKVSTYTSTSGKVTSVGNGECIITATCGGYSATCLISVSISIPCTGLSLNRSTLNFTSIGATQTLYATRTPSNTTDVLSWVSSNTNVATVNSNGVVTSKSVGSCTITAICGTKSATCSININVEKPVNTYSITNNLTNVSTNNPTTSIKEGQSYSATLTCGNDYDISSVIVTMNGVDITNSVYEPEYSEDPEEPTTIPCTSISLDKSSLTFTSANSYQTLTATKLPSNTTDTISWKSSNNNVATVTQFGLVTSIGDGTCIITATCGNYSASCNVLVNIEESINIYSITNNLTNVSTNNPITSIEEGQSYNAILTCENDYKISSVIVIMDGVDVTDSVYESEDSEDPTTIPCTSISLNKSSLTFTSTNSQTLVATILPSNTTDTISWKSNKTSIATVSNGVVTPKTNGECIITATCGNYSASCTVLVNIEESVNTYSIINNLTNVSTNNSITSIKEGQSYNAILTCGNDYEISSVVVTMNGVDVTNDVYEAEYENPESPTIMPCTSISLNKSIISFNALNTTQTLIATVFPSDTTDTISWSSSATNIAKVNNNGVVTSIGNGSCTITATCGSKSDTCAVNVSVNSGSSDLYTNPIISFDTDTYRVNLTQDGYSETFYVSYARNEETPGYKGIKQFYDNDSYPYYLTLADQGSSKFRINGNIPVDGYCLYTGGYYGDGYFLDLTTKALRERNLNMQFKVSGLSQELVQDAMDHINNNAMGSAINFNIIQSNSAPYSIELVNIEDEVLGYNYTMEGYIQINEWMMNDYYGEFNANDKRIFRRWRSTLVHELGHCLGFDDEAEHIPTMYNYYRDIEDDEAMCCLQANDWVFLETEFKNKLSFDLRTATTSTIPSYDLPNNELDIDAKKVKFTRPYYKDIDISNKADIILEGYLSYKETKELNVSKNEDKEVLIEYDIFAVTVKEFIKGSAIDIEIKIPKNELSINEESLYKLYLKQYNNTPCSPINLKQGIKKIQ